MSEEIINPEEEFKALEEIVIRVRNPEEISADISNLRDKALQLYNEMQYNKSLEYWQVITDNDSYNVEAWAVQALIYDAYLKQPERALSCYDKVTELTEEFSQENQMAWDGKARVLMALGRQDEADNATIKGYTYNRILLDGIE